MVSLLLPLYLAIAPAPISIVVMPTACFEPCSIRVVARIQAHPLNRWWIAEVYVADSNMLVQGSMRELEGDRAPITQPEIRFSGLAQGDYQVTAVLYRATVPSEAGRQAKRVTVLGAR